METMVKIAKTMAPDSNTTVNGTKDTVYHNSNKVFSDILAVDVEVRVVNVGADGIGG
jgi:hypothetical protein